MANILDLLKVAAEVSEYLLICLGAITVAGTIVARLTKTPKDDVAVGKAKEYLLGVIHWLPTIGVNPQTQALKELVETLKKKK